LNHITVGVYASGNYVTNIVSPEDLVDHVEYNKTMRFGRALFVDGKLVNRGYLSDEETSKWEEKISEMEFDSRSSSKPYK
jgi:hypothetical protein